MTKFNNKHEEAASQNFGFKQGTIRDRFVRLLARNFRQSLPERSIAFYIWQGSAPEKFRKELRHYVKDLNARSEENKLGVLINESWVGTDKTGVKMIGMF